MVTIRHLISNVAPGQSSLATKYILNALNAFYNKIKTGIQIVYAKNDLDGTLVYFKVPSENTDGLMYDVVIWFREKNKIGLETEVKVYSNSPGFAYNFVYVLNKDRGLLFKEEYPKEFLNIAPDTRNPLKVKSFDKHVYSAMKVIGARRTTLESLSNQFDTAVEPQVKSFKEKLKEIKELKAKKPKK